MGQIPASVEKVYTFSYTAYKNTRSRFICKTGTCVFMLILNKILFPTFISVQFCLTFFDKSVKKLSFPPPLPKILDHRRYLNEEILAAFHISPFPEMYHRELRRVNGPAVLLRHTGQVCVLAVKKISLVKSPHPFENVRAYCNKAARAEAHVGHFCNISVGKGVFPAPFAEHSPEPLKASPQHIS